MSMPSRNRLALLVATCGLAVGVPALAASGHRIDARSSAVTRPSASLRTAAGAHEGTFEGSGEIDRIYSSARWSEHRGVYLASMPGGREAELTLDRELQEDVEALVGGYDVPYAAVVALDPRDGRILAMAESSDRKDGTGSTTKAIFPAASIFKIVTGAALIEAGISPQTEVCFHGGLRSLGARELKDDPRRDHRCETLSTAMGKSLNVVFGKLAAKRLSSESLSAMAERFFFNQPLPLFGAQADDELVSRAMIPADPVGFGRTAAGFGQVYLSPLHGAVLAGAVANGGVASEPRLVRAVTVGGARIEAPSSRQIRIVDASTSAVLTQMMERTVSDGTARKFFRTRRGRGSLSSVTIAGKTGSLADHAPLPFKDYSWFVGFAPADNPRVAVATLVVNGPKWRVKAPFLAREALRSFFETDGGVVKHASR